MALTQVEAQTTAQRAILLHPEGWSECLSSFKNDAAADEILADADRDAEWLFMGYGSGYYLALLGGRNFFRHLRPWEPDDSAFRGTSFSGDRNQTKPGGRFALPFPSTRKR